MNSSILSFYDVNGFSIQFILKNNHLIEGQFNIDLKELQFQFSGIRNTINNDLQTIAFNVDWQTSLYQAHTTFCGFIKSNVSNPQANLEWLLVKQFNSNDTEEHVLYGKSVLHSLKPLTTQRSHYKNLPFPMIFQTSHNQPDPLPI